MPDIASVKTFLFLLEIGKLTVYHDFLSFYHSLSEHDKRSTYDLAMLLVRVNFGWAVCQHGRHDILLREIGRFREFKVWNTKRLCPEFLILYG